MGSVWKRVDVEKTHQLQIMFLSNQLFDVDVNVPHVNRPKTIRNKAKTIGKYPNNGWSLVGLAAQCNKIPSTMAAQHFLSTEARVETGTRSPQSWCNPFCIQHISGSVFSHQTI